MKYAWIDAHRNAYELAELCRVLAVSVSGYRVWRDGGTPERKRLTDAQMLTLIRAIYAELKGAYGSPRITKELRDRGFPASKERVERLMRENDIRARHKRRHKATTGSKHSLPVAPNLLDRNFAPAAPNRVWTADLTYIWTGEGWLYLAVVLDLFNREIVGWSIKPRMTADIVVDALTMAWFRGKPAPGLIHHSDRGSRYASHAFQARLKEYGMTCSMSRKGNCWDNAPTESFFNKRIGSALSMNGNWRHNAAGLEDEKQRVAHCEARMAFRCPQCVCGHLLNSARFDTCSSHTVSQPAARAASEPGFIHPLVMARKIDPPVALDEQAALGSYQLVVEIRPYLRIAHQISGRVRLKFDAAVLDFPALRAGGGERLKHLFASLPGVRDFSLNPLARSCIVEYDSAIIPDAAWPDLLAGRRSPAVDTLLALLAAGAKPPAIPAH